MKINLEEVSQKLSEACGCQVVDLNDIAESEFPKDLFNLPFMGNSENATSVRFISSDITDEVPTKEELNSHINKITESYGPIVEGWLLKLGCITLPGFHGEEPTIEEFFREDFDQNRVKPRYLLISYPIVKKTGDNV